MSNPALAPTTFAAGPNDTLAAVDVYKQTGLSTINNSRSLFGDVAAGNIPKTLDVKMPAAQMKGMLDVNAKGEIVVDRAALTKGIVQSNPQLSSAIAEMSTATKENVLVAGATSKIKASIDGVDSYVCKADLSSVNAIVRAVAGLTNLKLPYSFKDIGSLSAMGEGLVREAVSKCLNGVFSQLNKAPEFKGEPMNRITAAITPDVLKTTNNGLLKEVTDAGFGSIMLRKQPNFISKYLKNYNSRTLSLRRKKRDLGTSYGTDYRKMVSAFNVMDPGWQMTTRNNNVAINAAPQVGASKVAKKTIRAATNGSAPSAGTVITTAVAAGNASAINTATSYPVDAFSMVALNQSVTDVRTSLNNEIPTLALMA